MSPADAEPPPTVSAPGQAEADEPVVSEPETVEVAVAGQTLGGTSRFVVRLDNFAGPFDVLLGLIGKRQLDITEVALSQVTDDFIAYIAEAGKSFDLGEATEFLLVASTLLDLKAARLLPAAEVENEEDLALLEARDLLFARLLQYRAYKLAAAYLADLERAAARRYPRDAELEPRFVNLSPDLQIGVSLAQFAALAAAAFVPKPVPTVGVDHIHAQRVSVVEHIGRMRRLLSTIGGATFRSLIADCETTLEVVASFLGLLELYRDGVVAFDQTEALAELRIRWTGPDVDPDEPEQISPDLDEEYGL